MKTLEVNVLMFQLLMVNLDLGENMENAANHVEEDYKAEHEHVSHQRMEGKCVWVLLLKR